MLRDHMEVPCPAGLCLNPPAGTVSGSCMFPPCLDGLPADNLSLSPCMQLGVSVSSVLLSSVQYFRDLTVPAVYTSISYPPRCLLIMCL